uniref:twin-arginine translocation signal domain-containing protein n=1 Tax=Salmonella enterica TaxID=28901 RepID=UPI003D7697EA
MEINEETRKSSRRDFLRTSAASAAAVAATPAVAKSAVFSIAPGRVIGANDRISL